METTLTERDITKKMLEDAANDMSTVMKFESPIPTGKKITKAVIQADVIEAAEELRAEDVLKPKTVEVLTILGVALPVKEAGEENMVDALMTMGTALPAKEAGEAPPQPAPEHEETEEAKNDPAETPVAKTENKKGTSRVQAVCHILREAENGIDFGSLSSQSDALYAEDGKKSNMIANNREVTWVIQCLNAAGVLNEIDGRYSL